MSDVTKARRAIDRVVEIYVVLAAVAMTLYMIAPVVAWIADSPLRYARSVLGALGLVILIVDLCISRVALSAKYTWWLIAMCGAAVIGAIRTYGLGFTSNVQLIATAFVMATMFFSYAKRVGAKRAGRVLSRVLAVISAIWAVASVLSLLTYLWQIGYMQRTSADLAREWTRQGFLENRLFGVFMTINFAATITFILMLVCVYWAFKARVMGLRILAGAAAVLFWATMILSGSRSAEVAFAAACVWICVYGADRWLTHSRPKQAKPLVRIVAAIGIGVLGVAASLGLWNGSKIALAQLPSIVVSEELTSQRVEAVVQGAKIFGLDVLVEGGRASSEEISAEEVLERSDTGGDDVSNNRFTIWGDYLSMWREIGLFGFSPGNYNTYISQNHSDLFIVDFIRSQHEEAFNDGVIYHPHSMPLLVLVSSGAVGAAAMVVFFLLSLRDVVRRALVGRFDPRFALLVALVVGCVFFSLFDLGLIFKNNGVTVLFWITAGLVLELARSPKLEASPSQ